MPEESIRVLVVDDKEEYQEFVRSVFEDLPMERFFAFAKTFDEALEPLFHRYFDLLVLDLVLHDGPPGTREEWEGFWVLQEILDRGLSGDIPVIVITGFGDDAVARDAFYLFHVADFWDKKKRREVLSSALHNALKRENFFGLNCEVRFDTGLSWKALVQSLRLQFSRLSSPIEEVDAELELRHIIRKAFSDANSIVIAPMDRGGSNAALMRITPTYGDAGPATPVIVKYGPFEDVRNEYRGWRSIEHYVGGHKSTQVKRFVQGRQLSAIEYTLVGATLSSVVSFGRYYSAGSSADVISCLTKLFTETCGLWYSNLKLAGSEKADIAEAYASYLGFTPSSLETAFRFKYPEHPIQQEQITIVGLSRKLANPLYYVCEKPLSLEFQRWFCLTHGDLHGGNILVDELHGDPWLIDFGRSGFGHWCRDFVELETFIKFQLAQPADSLAVFELEDAVTSGEHLDDKLEFFRDDLPDLQKCFTAIRCLRQLAATLASGATHDSRTAMLEYYVALFYQTINFFRLHKLIKPHQRKNQVLISAALILEKIQGMTSEGV